MEEQHHWKKKKRKNKIKLQITKKLWWLIGRISCASPLHEMSRPQARLVMLIFTGVWMLACIFVLVRLEHSVWWEKVYLGMRFTFEFELFIKVYDLSGLLFFFWIWKGWRTKPNFKNLICFYFSVTSAEDSDRPIEWKTDIT